MEKRQLQSILNYRTEAPDWDKNLQQLIEYDIYGNKIKSIIYEEGEIILEETTCEYDSKRNLIQEKNHFPEDEVIEVINYDYDERGLLIKSSKKYAETEEDTTYYTYNSDQKLILKRVEGADGSLEQEETRSYQNGLLIDIIRKDSDGMILEKSTFSYNENQELKEELRYNPETEKEMKIIYDYHFSGKEPDITIYNHLGNIIERTRFTFDDKQRLIKEVHETNYDGLKKFTSHFSYDTNDQLIESKLLDKLENLIRKITYRHNAMNLLEEEIHYNGGEKNEEIKSHILTTEYKFYDLSN